MSNRPPHFSHTEQLFWLRRAIEVAAHCRDIEWYGVGAVLVGAEKQELTTGFTGEFSEGQSKQHAEAVAIEKASRAGITQFGDTVLFSTLEPCSLRASGKPTCTQRILQAGISVVVYGSKEPFDPRLQIVCEGDRLLREGGVEVVWVSEIAQECFQSTVQNRLKS